MTTDSNIYDIDGEIIRKAGDVEQMRIESAQQKIDSYKKKLKNLNILNQECCLEAYDI